MSCCTPILDGRTSTPSEDQQFANIGEGVDIYSDGTTVPAEFCRLLSINRGSVVGDDVSGGLEVLVDPNNASTNIVRFKNWLVVDTIEDTFDDTSFITVLDGDVEGVTGEEDWLIVWSALVCSGSSVGGNAVTCQLLLNDIVIDAYRTEDNVLGLPSTPQTRVIRGPTSGPTTLNVKIQVKNAAVINAVIESKQVWGILYDNDL